MQDFMWGDYFLAYPSWEWGYFVVPYKLGRANSQRPTLASAPECGKGNYRLYYEYIMY